MKKIADPHTSRKNFFDYKTGKNHAQMTQEKTKTDAITKLKNRKIKEKD